MAAGNKRISEMPAAASLTGDELVHAVQGGDSKQTTVAAIAPIRSADDVSDEVVALGSVSTNTAIPLDAAAVYTMTLAADVTLSVTGAPAGRSRVVQALITASGARTLAFSSGWLWDGAKPATMADGAKAMLTLNPIGDDVVASWSFLGAGS